MPLAAALHQMSNVDDLRYAVRRLPETLATSVFAKHAASSTQLQEDADCGPPSAWWLACACSAQLGDERPGELKRGRWASACGVVVRRARPSATQDQAAA
jgi:hypothetical protein